MKPYNQSVREKIYKFRVPTQYILYIIQYTYQDDQKEKVAQKTRETDPLCTGT